MNQSPALADATASARDLRAPAITANAAPSLGDVTNAHRETKHRLALKKMGFAVTDNEVAQSLIREHAVLSHHAANSGGVSNATLLATINNLQNTMADGFRGVNARIDNMECRGVNASSGHNTPLLMLVKQHPGMLPLADPMFVGHPPNIVGPVPLVGTPLPLPEGFTLTDLLGLNHQEISNLARMAGTNFGIVAGDNLDARREKIRSYFARRSTN